MKMPYYDYVQFFLGVDRKDPPDEFQQIYAGAEVMLQSFRGRLMKLFIIRWGNLLDTMNYVGFMVSRWLSPTTAKNCAS